MRNAGLAADPTASFTDLSRPAREALSFAHPDAAISYLVSWRTKTDPLAAAVDPLVDFGAAVHSRGRVTITPLGHWALETLQARAPRPISTDLTATELLTLLAQIDEDEQSYAAQPWLAGRAPLPASRDLLAAAATATPAQRIAAVELVHTLGPRADAAWGEAAAIPNLAAHVRLARDDLDEKAADWLAVEYAAAALPDHGPDEVLARLDDRFTGIGRDFQPEVIEQSGSPGALLRRGPLRTARAAFTAGSSSKLRDGAGCRFLSVPRSPPRRREDPLPQPPYVVLMRAPVDGVPHQGIVRRSVHHEVSNLPSDSDGLTSIRFTAHLPTSAPLSRPGHRGPVSGQLSSNGHLEEQPRTLWFPVGFRPPAFASWASCSRQEDSAIPYGWPTGPPKRPGLCRGSRVPHV